MSSVQLPDDDSSPFWKDPAWLLAAVPVVVSVLVIFGYVPQSDVSNVNQLFGDVVKNAFLFGTSVVGVWNYFKKSTQVEVTRMTLKAEFLREQLRSEALRAK